MNKYPYPHCKRSGRSLGLVSSAPCLFSIAALICVPGANVQAGSLVAPAPGAAVPVSAPTPQTAATASTDSAPSSAATVAAQRTGVPVVRGRPLLVTGGWTGTIEREGIASVDEVAAIGDFLDHIRIGLNPDFARASGSHYSDDRALCVANRLLRAPLQDEVLMGGAWKGANEFEIQRAKQRFNELLPALVATAPALPMKFVLIEPLFLGPYDHDLKAFPFNNLRPIEIDLPRSGCRLVENDYLPIATELPSSWPLDPQAAEALIQRVPAETGAGNRQTDIRKVFVAVELTLSGVPESPAKDQRGGTTMVVPMKIEVESVAFYEDPDLERHLYTFGLDKPAPSVLLSGIPDDIPRPEPRPLDEEALTLLLLQAQGDVLSDVAWHVLARQQAHNDQIYYKKERHRRLGTSVQYVDLQAYDPDYVPFFPLGKTLSHHEKLDANQLNAFREWSLARARALGTRFELTGTLRRERASQGGYSGKLELELGLDLAEQRYMAETLEAAGYATGRIIRPTLHGPQPGTHLDTNFLASPEGGRSVYLMLAHPLERLVPGVTSERLDAPPDAYAAWPVVMEVVVTDVELMAVTPDSRSYVNRPVEAVLVHLEPRSVQVYEDGGGATLFAQDYDVAALRAEVAATAKQAADAEAAARTEQERAASEVAAYRQQLAQADIAGLKLGMTLAEADRMIRERLDIGWIATAADDADAMLDPARPYREWKTYISADGKEEIVLFSHQELSDRVVAIARTLALPETTSTDAVIAALREKYGEPVDNPSRSLLWSTDLEEHYGTKSQRRGCSAGVGSAGGAYNLRVDGREFTFEELKLISTRTPIISVHGSSGGPQGPWNAAEWRGCGPSVVAEVADIRLSIAMFNLGEYAASYQQWLASQKSDRPAVPEL